MTEALQLPPAVDPEKFPFRAQLDYAEYGNQAGLITSSQVPILYEAVAKGDIEEDERELYNRHAFDIVRAFVEYGYGSRESETVVLTDRSVVALVRKAAESNFAWVDADMPDVLEEASPILKSSLNEVARRAYMWGRTDDPFDPTELGAESTLAS